MELKNPEHGRNHNEEENEEGEGEVNHEQKFGEDIDSSCSTPYVSAPSSPGHASSGYFFSAPASPMHFVLSSSAAAASKAYVSSSSSDVSVSGSFEFEFSSRFSSNGSAVVGSMISADELFLNGQIRPMKLSSHLQRPQLLAPLMDLEVEDDDEIKDEKDLELGKTEHSVVRGRDLRLRNRSLHRRTRSLSPLRNASSFQWEEEEENREEREIMNARDLDSEQKESEEMPSTETTPSVSASSSRSSSSGRSSKRWVFLKDFLRSKSEGRGNAKDKFWHGLSFSPAKDKKSSSLMTKDKIPLAAVSTKPETQTQKSKATAQSLPAKKTGTGKPANGVAKRRRPPSPHELHYTANRAQAEEMKKRTFLPYRQGLLGCLGFSSKGYGAMNGFAKSLNPVSSR